MSFLKRYLYIFSVGMAMFSMFFGAGNVVFPLIVGQATQDKALFALLGLVITAVGVPFVGLFAMTLFEGNYRSFFERIGKIPGFLVALLIMGLIGPFGAIPRCIALSYSTLKMFFPSVELIVFSIISCVSIALLTIRKNRILDLLGYVLTPFLLLTLACIIIKGFFVHPEVLVTSEYDANSAFFHGLESGYQTMDLLGAFFFCGVVINSLKSFSSKDGVLDQKLLTRNTLYASCIGAFLLAIVYVGMSFVAAFHSQTLTGVTSDVILGTVALHVLGPYAGILTCAAVILACLTTAIALAAVFAEFVQNYVFSGKVRYEWALIGSLIVTFFISTLEFTGILHFLAPIIEFLYPALIILTFANIAFKLRSNKKAVST